MDTDDDQQWRDAIEADKPWQQEQEALLNAFALAADGFDPKRLKPSEPVLQAPYPGRK